MHAERDWHQGNARMRWFLHGKNMIVAISYHQLSSRSLSINWLTQTQIEAPQTLRSRLGSFSLVHTTLTSRPWQSTCLPRIFVNICEWDDPQEALPVSSGAYHWKIFANETEPSTPEAFHLSSIPEHSNSSAAFETPEEHHLLQPFQNFHKYISKTVLQTEREDEEEGILRCSFCRSEKLNFVTLFLFSREAIWYLEGLHSLHTMFASSILCFSLVASTTAKHPPDPSSSSCFRASSSIRHLVLSHGAPAWRNNSLP